MQVRLNSTRLLGKPWTRRAWRYLLVYRLSSWEISLGQTAREAMRLFSRFVFSVPFWFCWDSSRAISYLVPRLIFQPRLKSASCNRNKISARSAGLKIQLGLKFAVLSGPKCKCFAAFSLRIENFTLICIYGDCNAILPFTSRKNLDFCSAFGIRLLVYQIQIICFSIKLKIEWPFPECCSWEYYVKNIMLNRMCWFS